MIATVYPDHQTLCAASASRIAQLIASALQMRSPVSVCLTGGPIACAVYQEIAEQERRAPRIDWNRVHFFWGDERDVPGDHPDSNQGMAVAALLAHVPVDPSFLHPIPADGRDAEAAACAYEETLQQTVFASRADYAFDLMLLGIGSDAHIASLFPGAEALEQSSIAHVVAVPAAADRGRRITLTPATLLDARRILMIVSGHDKADAVHAAFSQPEDVARWPAQILRQASDRVEWLMDSAADGRAHAARPSR